MRKQKRSGIVTLRAFLRRFRDDTKGSMALFMAAGLMATVGAIAVATDTSRGYLVKARLSQALDAAGLAGGRVMYSPTQRDADINMYFNANFPSGYMEAVVSGPNITPIGDDVIAISASATVPTTLTRIFGIDTFNVSAQTEITRATTALDVVLAIDMSGSMTTSDAGGGQTRIQAARGAAVELVNILFGADEIKSLLKIGVVPWNSKVNVMLNSVAYDSAATTIQAVPSFLNPLTGDPQNEVYLANNSPVPLLSAPVADWQGCVFQRYKDNGATDDDADVILGSLSFTGGDWVAWEPIGPEGEPVPGSAECDLSLSSSQDCDVCLDHGITPLTSTKSEALAAVNELQNAVGGTNVPQGLGWAWRVLMPGAPFDEADPNPPGNRQQAIVLLTDGENCGWWGDGYKGIWIIGSSAACAESRDEMDARLEILATNIKASGVDIYTIQFANSGTEMQALLKSVATKPDSPYYHYAPDAATLQTVFQEIANHLSTLRLSK